MTWAQVHVDNHLIVIQFGLKKLRATGGYTIGTVLKRSMVIKKESLV
jgi:hypothetical protein